MSTSTTTASNVSPPKPASTPSSSTSAQVTIPEIPDGYTIFTENTASILLPSTDEAFLNPVQEFNRDMSVACIRVWSDELNQVKEERWKRVNEGGVKVKGKGKKKLKTEGAESLEKKGEEADVEIKDQSEVSITVRSYYYLSQIFVYTEHGCPYSIALNSLLILIVHTVSHSSKHSPQRVSAQFGTRKKSPWLDM